MKQIIKFQPSLPAQGKGDMEKSIDEQIMELVEMMNQDELKWLIAFAQMLTHSITNANT